MTLSSPSDPAPLRIGRPPFPTGTQQPYAFSGDSK